MEMLSILLSVVGFIIPLLVVGVVIYIILTVSKNKNGNTKFKLSSKTLLQIYLYVLSFLTLGICVIGATTAIKAAISFQFDIPFSYTLQKAQDYEEAKMFDAPLQRSDFKECYSGDVVSYYDTDFCFDNNERRTDLINGITLFVSMAILFFIHQYALSKIKKEKRIGWLKKIYTFASLILYSVVSIVAIPTAIYQLTNYILFEAGEGIYQTPNAPAMPIAIALISIPLWILFLRETMQLKED